MINTVYSKETISDEIHTKWAGKTVHFAKESSVMMSILLRPEFEPQYASMLTLVMGLSVAQAVKELDVEVSIKWPNDVVVSRKKICGILTEMGLENGKIREVIIGIGINVNLEEIQDDLKDKATSLYLETGKKYDRNRVIGLIMEKFEKNYEKFVKTCDLSLMLDDYNAMLANRSQPVRILDKLNPYEGIAIGIDREGELLVKVSDGAIRKVCSGEVSVRVTYDILFIRSYIFYVSGKCCALRRKCL